MEACFTREMRKQNPKLHFFFFNHIQKYYYLNILKDVKIYIFIKYIYFVTILPF